MITPGLGVAASVLLLAASGLAGAADDDFTPVTRLRRPIALAAGDARLFVANRTSGSLSVVDLKSQSVVGETLLGGRLSDLAAVPGSGRLLVLDEERHQLLLLDAGESGVRVAGRLDVPHSPLDVEVSPDGKLCSVTSLWARQLTLIDVGREPTIRATLDLPFAPRMQRFVGDERLIVADAFGGRLAVVDVAKGMLTHEHSIAGHNIRGLAVGHGGGELHVAHQLLNADRSTTHDHVFWGEVMRNFVRSVPLDDLLAQNQDRPSDSLRGITYPLGHPSGATGDPGSMLVTPRGAAALLLSGVDEIALRSRPRGPFVRRKVGRRPTALCLGPGEHTLYVANTFDDSISVVDLAALKVTATIPLGPQPPLTPAERGELLFYDARLSLDGWYSCHSCHTDGHTNGLLNDNLGDDYFGDAKLVPSLLGTGRTHPWAWNGKADSLEAQIAKSITVTMQGEQPSEQTVGDLAAYLHTLEPPPGLPAARGTLDRNLVDGGRLVFGQHGCADCHAPPAYTTPAAYDVGLADKSGHKEFNPPSLSGVSQRGPYFHDGRAKSLRDVPTRYRHNLERPLSEAELEGLLEFLGSL